LFFCDDDSNTNTTKTASDASTDITGSVAAMPVQE
jgi:hypothetical protein